jgi:hypothetical protein
MRESTPATCQVWVGRMNTKFLPSQSATVQEGEGGEIRRKDRSAAVIGLCGIKFRKEPLHVPVLNS